MGSRKGRSSRKGSNLNYLPALLGVTSDTRPKA